MIEKEIIRKKNKISLKLADYILNLFVISFQQVNTLYFF